MQGLVQAMQTQAHTQAALQAQLEAQERADVWWTSLLRTRFEDGVVDVAWDELVAFDHRTLDEALSAAYRQEGEMEQYLEEKKASQKRPTARFQRQDKKKAVYQVPQHPVTTNSAHVPSVHSPGVMKQCPHCGKTHGCSECWMVAEKCLKCGSSDHKIKDCLRLQQGVQRRAPAPAAVAAAAPATGRLGRPRAPARVFALAHEDAEQAEHVTEAQLSLRSPILDEVIEQQKSEPRLLELVGKAGIARDEDGGSRDIGEGFPNTRLKLASTKNPEQEEFGGFLGLLKESFNNNLDPFGDFPRVLDPHTSPSFGARVCVLHRPELDGMTPCR
ncbi:hypothetical protein Taro_046611 [Colocasia esculenta]|uniref:CCHC-type domain-containing protein n=1 Tax=Colocasia esculenta TaxID=4460 RepID=A0A843X5T0_COLES|nr:hypothetical protein [Colocasia esculenta]